MVLLSQLIALNSNQYKFWEKQTVVYMLRTSDHNYAMYVWILKFVRHMGSCYMWPDVWLLVQMLKWRHYVKWRQNNASNYYVLRGYFTGLQKL